MPSPGQMAAASRPGAGFAALFQAGDSWFDADNVTTSGSNTTGLVDRMDASHSLTQATGASQCGLPSTSVAFGNKNVLTFTGAQHYISNRPASAWKYLHDGTGVTLICVYAPAVTNQNLASYSTYGAGVGCAYSFGVLSGGTTQVSVQRVGANVFSHSGGSLTAGVGTYNGYTMAGTYSAFSKTTVLGSGTVTSPSSADPAQTLMLGGLLPAANLFQGPVRALYIWKRVLTAPQLVIARAYITADSGIT